MNENESGTPFEDFLRSVLGDEAAAEAARALEAQGFDPANLPAEFSDPARMRAAMGQFQFLMNTTAGPVNWPAAIQPPRPPRPRRRARR